MNRGRLLVSVRPGGTPKALIVMLCVVAGILEIIFFAGFDDFITSGFSTYGGMAVRTVLLIAVLILLPVSAVLACLSLRSYCEIYENAVVGTTLIGTKGSMGAAQNFELSWDEILNVTESYRKLILHTRYAEYHIYAFDKPSRDAAIREIRMRTGGQNHADAAAQTRRPVGGPHGGNAGFCAKCGAPISQPSKFCAKCGSPLQ